MRQLMVVAGHIGMSPDLDFGVLLVATVGSAWLYHRGSVRLPGMRDRARRSLAFWGALVMTVLVFSPPAEDLADALFAAHMIQHLILIVPVPLMLVYARAGHCLISGSSRTLRRVSRPPRRLLRRAHPLRALPVVGVVFALVLWVWHLPVAYDAAVANDWLHLVEHAAFLGSAVLFWAAIIDRRHGFLPRSMLVFGTGFHCGLLGALLVFAPVTLYRSHLAQTPADLTPLQDQQLAGAIMWLPMGAVFLATIAALLIRALEQPGTGSAADA